MNILITSEPFFYIIIHFFLSFTRSNSTKNAFHYSFSHFILYFVRLLFVARHIRIIIILIIWYSTWIRNLLKIFWGFFSSYFLFVFFQPWCIMSSVYELRHDDMYMQTWITLLCVLIIICNNNMWAPGKGIRKQDSFFLQ